MQIVWFWGLCLLIESFTFPLLSKWKKLSLCPDAGWGGGGAQAGQGGQAGGERAPRGLPAAPAPWGVREDPGASPQAGMWIFFGFVKAPCCDNFG